ncbi:MAG TPA: SDR family oxidoreductase [Terriglobia bacterium]|nr:SDR family oxidoreductase [Terriglobia bacterium]
MAEDLTNERLLAGQVAVVTGSTRGIGAGIAKKFAEHGARVVVHGRDPKEGETVVAAIREGGSEAVLVTGDLADAGHCRDLIRQAIERFGRLDILVNNAASTERGNIETTSLELWDRILAVNLRAPFVLCQEAVKHMKGRCRGCIVNIGSVNAHGGMRKLLPYSASKGGLMTFTRNLANDLARDRIRVNQINPGWVLTEGEHHVQSVAEGRGEQWLEDAVETRPFGRLITPEEIARAALFFASNELITGAVLDYDQIPVGMPVE